MDDTEIISRIGALVEEERSLEHSIAAGGPDESAAERLRQVEVALDQCWDLLRQRRAKARAGENPDEAGIRPAGQVEGYIQ